MLAAREANTVRNPSMQRTAPACHCKRKAHAAVKTQHSQKYNKLIKLKKKKKTEEQSASENESCYATLNPAGTAMPDSLVFSKDRTVCFM